MGKPLIFDKSGTQHLGISRFPFIITKVKSGKLKNAINLAKQNPNLLVADYPNDIFSFDFIPYIDYFYLLFLKKSSSSFSSANILSNIKYSESVTSYSPIA